MEDHQRDRKRPKFELKASLSDCFKIVLHSDTFVDKTELISSVLENDPVILLTAPHSFGKTVNLTMMRSFLELEVDQNNGTEKTTLLEEKDNYKLFSSRELLKVMKNKKLVETHFGQYPIIEVTFECTCAVKSRSDAVNACRNAIRKAYRKHSYLYKSGRSLTLLTEEQRNVCKRWCDIVDYKRITAEQDIKEGLSFLAECLNKFHKRKVFLLVDEYDSIISNTLCNVRNPDPRDDFATLESAAKICIQAIVSPLSQNANIVKGAFITGVLNVAGVMFSFSSLVSGVVKRQFGSGYPYQAFYGFNEEEMGALFNKWDVENELKEKVMAKYNGYYNGAKPLANPLSVVMFLNNFPLEREAALQNYWHRSADNRYLNALSRSDELRRLFNRLLEGVEDFKSRITPLELRDLKSLHYLLIGADLNKCKVEVVVKFLISLGYVTYCDDDEELRIPNGEIMDEFKKLFNGKGDGGDDSRVKACL